MKGGLVRESSIKKLHDPIKMSGDINADLRVELYSSKLHRLLGSAVVKNDDLLHSVGLEQDAFLTNESLAEVGGLWGTIGLQLTSTRSLTANIIYASDLNPELFTKHVQGTYATVSFKKDSTTEPVQIHRTHSRSARNAGSPVWEEECPTQKLPFATEMRNTSVTVTVWCSMTDADDLCVGEAVVDAFEIMDGVKRREPVIVPLGQDKKRQTRSSEIMGNVAVSFSLTTVLEASVNQVQRDSCVPNDGSPNTPYAILYLGEKRVVTTSNAQQDESDPAKAKWSRDNYKIRLTGTVHTSDGAISSHSSRHPLELPLKTPFSFVMQVTWQTGLCWCS
jgi:hypothetical protein